MKPVALLLALVFALLGADPAVAQDDDPQPVYEMRTYHPHEGKLDALHARFRDHTCALFTKHGIENVGYWTPESGEFLVYLVRYPSRDAREASWKGFLADPVWKAAYAASTADGKLVAKIDSQFLQTTDFSPNPELKIEDPPRLFELRTYTVLEGRLPALHARFRDHTCALFEKQGMTNLWYFQPMADQEGSTRTLVYFLAHKDAEAREASFKAFTADPAWVAARDASQADGEIVAPKGVKSVLLKSTDYSPLR